MSSSPISPENSSKPGVRRVVLEIGENEAGFALGNPELVFLASVLVNRDSAAVAHLEHTAGAPS
jgi:hypothetical protein